ncbi:cyclin-domain-containing protein [Mycotypha africana]|uniref:cyclin-domain-containing protein n=1 Tax=Mycotypha africana TaxID=64632 RepID=UPI002300BEE8|nr:cyclin-domain-containing protein [Mycotypha africana]KAI8987626.1 cyclin-domain-containing protein [Mycotypha africana]
MLPITFDLAKYPTIDTIRLLAALLERMTIANDLLSKQQHQCSSSTQTSNRRNSLVPVYTRFHARLVPSIDIYSYLSRILKYCPCANECFLSLLVYFDRMSKNSMVLTGKPFTIDSFNIHRLIIAGVMVSSKFFSDVFYTNTRYAKVGGLPVNELNSLEIEFLKLNGYNLTVPISELQKYGDQLLKVGYIQEMRKPAAFRHSRSSSFDVARKNDMERVCELTQRMSLDGHGQQYYQQQQYSHPRHNSNNFKRHSNSHYYSHNQSQQQQQPSLRRMTSTSSLKDNRPSSTANYDKRYSRSNVNLTQGCSNTHNQYKGLYSYNQQQQQQRYTEGTICKSSNNTVSNGSDNIRRISMTSIHAPPFVPNNEINPQQQQQQQQQQNIYYYYPQVGLPTPPPSASPIDYHSPTNNLSAMYL